MKSQEPGPTALDVEVFNISTHGIWLYVSGKEYFLAHEDYPWFRNTHLDAVLNVQLLHKTHLYWPDLDVDLDIDCLEHPEKARTTLKRLG